MLEHAKRHRGESAHGEIYEVDRYNYTEFCDYMRWTDPPEFPPCRPTLRGTSRSPPPDARRRIEERAEIRGLRLTPPTKRDARMKKSREEREEKPLGRREGKRSERDESPGDGKIERRTVKRSKRDESPRDDRVERGTVRGDKSEKGKNRSVVRSESKKKPATQTLGSVAPQRCQPSATATANSEDDDTSWRIDLLAGAAYLRQQAAQLHLQAETNEQQAERMERAARRRREVSQEDEQEEKAKKRQKRDGKDRE